MLVLVVPHKILHTVGSANPHLTVMPQSGFVRGPEISLEEKHRRIVCEASLSAVDEELPSIVVGEALSPRLGEASSRSIRFDKYTALMAVARLVSVESDTSEADTSGVLTDYAPKPASTV